MRKERYKFTIRHHGLRDYDVEKINYIFEASSAKDAVRRVDYIYKRAADSNIRLSYYAKQFLEAVAISAETDMLNP